MCKMRKGSVGDGTKGKDAKRECVKTKIGAAR